jgi:hypothetical protein
MKAVASLFGAETEGWFGYSRITGAALDHGKELAMQWDKKIVIIEEIQGTGSAVENLRVAISEGKLNFLRAEESKDEEGNKVFKTVSESIPLNCLFVTCNAGDVEDASQLNSRAWILNTDVSKEQTGKVIDYYLKEFKGGIKREIPNLQEIRSALKFLKVPDSVDFPYSDEIRELFNDDNVRVRRDVKKIITLAKACAFFHQKKRKWVERDGKLVLLAEWYDVYLVFKYAGAAFNASCQGMGAKDIDYYRKITVNSTYVPEFGIDDVQRWCGVPYGTAKRIMSTFVSSGRFENKTRTPLPAMYCRTNTEPKSYDAESVLEFCKAKISQIKAKGG